MLISAALLAASALSQAAPSYMDAKGVKAGMSGYGLTVFKGIEPERFDFTVIAVTKGDGGLSDLIIVRVSGKNMEQSGGIAAGMSGSPCYISDKLVGALSHVLEGPDSDYGIITPMAEMVKALESGKLAAFPTKMRLEGYGSFVAAATPIWVSGLGDRALSGLTAKLSAKGIALAPLPALGQGLTTIGKPDFKPGSAVAVQVSYGGIEAGALGTMTWTDGKSFLAFGHPFMSLGSVEIPMSQSEVLAVLPSNGFPFKMGTFEKPAATVTEDRTTAIAGIIGSTPAMVDVSVKVTDMQTGRKREASFKAVPDARILADLISSAALSVCDSSIMRVGEGTSYLSVLIEASGMRMLREDMVWSGNDVAAEATMELSDMISMLMGNDVEEPGITSVEVILDIAPARLTAVIEGIELPEGGFTPGVPAQVGVVLRPFRAASFTRYVEVTIPEGSPAGEIEVYVRGGASEEESETVGIFDKLGETGGLNVAELLRKLETSDQNNGLVIEIRYIEKYGQEPGYDEAAPEEEETPEEASGQGIVEDEPYDGYGYYEETDEPYLTERALVHSVVSGNATGNSQVR